MAVIGGDYWDDHIVAEIVALLRAYADLFPCSFMEMKGVVGEVSEMKIELKPGALPIQKRSE